MMNKEKILKLQADIEDLRTNPDNTTLDRIELTGMLKAIDMILDPKQTVENEMGEQVRLYPYL